MLGGPMGRDLYEILRVRPAGGSERGADQARVPPAREAVPAGPQPAPRRERNVPRGERGVRGPLEPAPPSGARREARDRVRWAELGAARRSAAPKGPRAHGIREG